MSLATLTVDDLRCIEHAELEWHPGRNLIWGGNGSGKTSLLESVFLLGRGRSFRTRNSERLIRYGREQLVVFGRTAAQGRVAAVSSAGDADGRDLWPVPGLGPSSHDAGLSESMGLRVSRAKGGTEARISGRKAESLAELSQVFPVQVIEPGIHKLVEEGGHRRRRWLDWAVFHVEPLFVQNWVRYMRALKQRNAALKMNASHAGVWDAELARAGEVLAESRWAFMDRLRPYWQETVLALSGLEPDLQYMRGWAQDVTLAEALAASHARDAARQLTHPGPHRADILIKLQGRAAREVLSRGQQKLVAVAMTLAQLRVVQEATQTRATLLLDDPAAELDGEHLLRFIEQVSQLQSQLILTSLHPNAPLFGTPDRMFHVEQGRVRTML